MVLIRKHAIIRRVKDITIGSTLTLILLGGSGALQSCDNGGRYRDEGYETTYSRGVQTYIQEVSKGEFKITDEKTVDPEDSKVFISYLDGHTDTLNLEEAKRIVDQREYRDHQGSYYHESGLSNVLFYGGMGYLLGRSFSSPPNPVYYSSPTVYERSRQTSTELSRSRAVKPSNSKGGFFGKSRSSGFRGFGG